MNDTHCSDENKSIGIFQMKNAGVAQLVEQLICNQQVGGSSPSTSSSYIHSGNIPGEYGRIPERPKGADCKSVASSFDGSNPSSPTRNVLQETVRRFSFVYPTCHAFLYGRSLFFRPSLSTLNYANNSL